MAARHKVNPNQFKLFMGGQEMQAASVHSVDLGERQTMKGLWASKLRESKHPLNPMIKDQRYQPHGAGVYESIQQHGYRQDPDENSGINSNTPTLHVSKSRTPEPVLTQGEGHHRVAAAADIERKTGRNVWLPVRYV